MFVKPKEGLKVRDPVSKLHIPETGKEVPENSYWLRLLEAGDIQKVSSEDKTTSVKFVSKNTVA